MYYFFFVLNIRVSIMIALITATTNIKIYPTLSLSAHLGINSPKQTSKPIVAINLGIAESHRVIGGIIIAPRMRSSIVTNCNGLNPERSTF